MNLYYLIFVYLDYFSHEIMQGNRNKMAAAAITGGKIEASRVIEHLYQLTYSLPLNGKVIPNEDRTYEFIHSNGTKSYYQYNPTQVILDANYCTMALHHLLSRRVLLQSEINMVKRLSTLCQMVVHRLFIFKQLLIGSNKRSGALKPHLVGCHQSLMLELNGPANTQDADMTESAHVKVKGQFAMSSKHLDNFKELLQMDRTEKITKIIEETAKKLLNPIEVDDNFRDFEQHGDDNELNENEHETMWQETKLGKVLITINKENIWMIGDGSNSNKLPLHRIITLYNVQTLFNYNLQDKARLEGWFNIGRKCVKKQAQISLLNAIKIDTLHEKSDSKHKFLIYAQRNYSIKSAPGIRASNTYIDRFNCVEVGYFGILLNEYFNFDMYVHFIILFIICTIYHIHLFR